MNSFSCCCAENFSVFSFAFTYPVTDVALLLRSQVFFILTPTLSLQDKATFLLVLDAVTFEELGRASVPVNMAYGFHGTFTASP